MGSAATTRPSSPEIGGDTTTAVPPPPPSHPPPDDDDDGEHQGRAGNPCPRQTFLQDHVRFLYDRPLDAVHRGRE